MRIKFIFQLLIFNVTFISCNQTKRLLSSCKPSNEIEVDKTEMIKLNGLIGGSDYEHEEYVCGLNVTHIKSWWTYHKFGLAIYTEYHSPERQDGYRNNIVRNIRIFDTTNFKNKRSKQHYIYYNQEFPAISPITLDSIFGKAAYIKTKDTKQYYFFDKRQIAFVFDKKTKAFLKLYMTK